MILSRSADSTVYNLYYHTAAQRALHALKKEIRENLYVGSDLTNTQKMVCIAL